MVCKESVVEEMTRVEFDEQLKNSTVILIDVAGTTTALSFIKETLLPYVIENVKTYLSENWNKESIIELLNKLREENTDLPKDGDKDTQLDKFVEYIITKTKEDISASAPIKTIQGLVYEHGYTNGKLKGHVFEDVALALESWSSGRYNRKVCVYSTGSIESQKLLFEWSSSGNLTAHINTHFDQTNVGSKTEASSYQKIATQLDCKPQTIVFLTDSVEEAKAASEAGVNAVLVNREGNTPIQDEHKKLFPIVKSFKELPLNEVQVGSVDATDSDVSTKRKLPADEEPQTETEPPSKIAKTEEIVKVNEKVITTSADVENDNKQQDQAESTTITTSTESNHHQVVEKNETTSSKKKEEAMEGVEEAEESPTTNSTPGDDKKQDEIKINNSNNDDVEQKSKTEVASSTTTDTVETMEIDDEALSSVSTNVKAPSLPPTTTEQTSNITEAVTTTCEKKSTESKGTQVALKVSNADVASQAEIDLKDQSSPQAEVTTVTAMDTDVESNKKSEVKLVEEQSETSKISSITNAEIEQKPDENDEKEQVKSTSTSNDEIKVTKSTSNNDNDDVKSTTTNNEATATIVKEVIEAAVQEKDTIESKKQDGEINTDDKPDTTNAEAAECNEMNGDDGGVEAIKVVQKKIEEKIETTTLTVEETTTTNTTTSTSGRTDVEQTKTIEQETENKTTEKNNDNDANKKTEQKMNDEIETETTKTKKNEIEGDDDAKKVAPSLVEKEETKQTDDHVPAVTEIKTQVKENGSTTTTTTETLASKHEHEKTEQEKTENTNDAATKSNGANGITKNDEKNGNGNGNDDKSNKNGVDLKTTNGDNTTTSNTNGSDDNTTTTTTTEIKVKTVSDVVGDVATSTPTSTTVDDGVTTVKE